MGRARATIPTIVDRALRRGRGRRPPPVRSPIVRQCDDELAVIVDRLSSG